MEADYDIFARCNHCCRGVVATYFDAHHLDHQINRCDPDEIAPPGPNTSAPQYTPEQAAEFYRQGTENIPGNPDAAGAMFRKTLEAALKDKFMDRDKKPLAQRIAEAAKTGGLTRDLADWAHQIRLDGNDATHDKFTADHARDMQVFTELVLRYLFELPGMLKKAQQRTSKDEESAQPDS